jgi:translation initiation factor IF-3
MIRVREVLLIDEKGENLGPKKIEDAQRYAEEKSLDLVEISPQARPPVCRVMDYGKWKYEQAVKAKQARKHRSQIGAADYETKKNHVRRFLEADDKVKVTIMFRGREVVHSSLGRDILDRVALDVADVGVVENRPMLEGRNMTMMIGPSQKKKEVKAEDEVAAPEAAIEIEVPTPDDSPEEASE